MISNNVFRFLLVFLVSLHSMALGEGSYSFLRVDGSRVEKRITELAVYGKVPSGGVHRVAFGEEDKEARVVVMEWMREAGLTVRIDAASNIIGRVEGEEPDLPAIVLGSHTDTVPHGGKYDGALGVIAALECAQVLHENGISLRHPLEVIVFSDEEGGTIGSRAMIGRMTDEALQVVSHSGKTVGEGMDFLSGDVARFQEASRRAENLLCFIELHIEQGATLEAEDIDIGVVQGIVGIHWWDVVVAGAANHAGTTPMDQRRDALLAAARLVIGVNEVVTSMPGRHVGTVGRIAAEPGAPNVIPGRVLMSLEIRDLSDEKIKQIFHQIETRAREIESESGTRITFSAIDAKSVPAPMDESMQSILAETAGSLGYSFKLMPSGAGHDAQNMARVCPTGMIFVPSVGGISHSPKEFTHPEDMVKGANVILHSVLKIDGGKLGRQP